MCFTKKAKLGFGVFLLLGVTKLALGVETITVAATEYPNGEILESAVKPLLAKQGYDLKIIYYPSYNDDRITFHQGPQINWQSTRLNPNFQVIDGKADANFFQHQAYLDEFNQNYSVNLLAVESVFYVPYGLYVAKGKESALVNTKNPHNIQSGSTVLIPDYFINEERSLHFLQNLHLLALESDSAHLNLQDITNNPYQLDIYKADSSLLPTMLDSQKADIVIMNSGQASRQGIAFNRAIMIEPQNSRYLNILVTTKDNLNKPKLKALAKALHSEEVKKFIQTKYHGEVIPAF